MLRVQTPLHASTQDSKSRVEKEFTVRMVITIHEYELSAPPLHCNTNTIQ